MLRTHYLLAVLPGLLLFTGCSEPVTTPTKFARWNAKDGTFAIDYPEGWKADGGGKQGIQWAEFSKGSCVITVDTNLTTSLIGDIASSGPGGAEDVPEELEPAAAAHEFMKDSAVGDKFSGYKEEAAIKFGTGIGDARKSVFTGAKGLSGKVKGYRVTIPQSDKGLIIFAYGPAKHWEKLQPAYDKILEGIERGTPE
jgi:hypothetical protein